MESERPLIVAVGGFTSEVGKTTLLCELLQAFPGWEAIKTTRGSIALVEKIRTRVASVICSRTNQLFDRDES